MPGLTPAVGIISNTPFSFVASWSLWAVPMSLPMGFISYHAGMTGGPFTATEAGAIGALGAIMISLTTRKLDFAVFRTAMIETLQTSASLFIIGVALRCSPGSWG